MISGHVDKDLPLREVSWIKGRINKQGVHTKMHISM